MVKVFDVEDTDEIIDTLTSWSQPIYLYYFESDSDYLVASDKEIDEDDLDNVARELVNNLENSKEDDDADLYDDQT